MGIGKKNNENKENKDEKRKRNSIVNEKKSKENDRLNLETTNNKVKLFWR